MKIRAAGLFVCLLAAAPVAAQQPNLKPSPPSAAEFTALANQVATLTNQVTALQAQVTTLTTDATSPAGTWIVVSRGLALKNNPPRISEDFAAATIVLQTNGTGTVTFNGANTDLTLSVPPVFEREAGTLSGAFTWTTDGTRLTMTFPDGDQLGGYLAAGGRALLTAIADTNGPDGSWSDLWIGIKLPPQ